VLTFKDFFEYKGVQLQQMELKKLQQAKEQDAVADSEKRRRGRPNLYQLRLPKSKVKEVSDNTAAYTKARLRLDKKLPDKIFNYSTDFKELNAKPWHGMYVSITDGTYFQMQDTPHEEKRFFVTLCENNFIEKCNSIIFL